MSENDNGYRLTKKKKTRRGFVMTGGGAKGLYEAGVLQAFHLCNMSFDVITGSSIGAINSVAYAEYLLKKSDLKPASNIDDVLEIIDDMEDHINVLHSAWLTMPEVDFLDDSEEGPFGDLKNELNDFDLNLPMLTRLIWWWTTPENKRDPLPLMDLVNLIKELLQRLGGRGLIGVINGLRLKSDPIAKVILDTYLENLGIGTAFVDPVSERKLKDHFTKEHVVLTEELLLDEDTKNDTDVRAVLMPADRTFKHYHEKNIDVRLTRANFRTGLLEISAYVTKKMFAHSMSSFWRFETMPEEGFPVTSFRLELPGNPVAIEAALASSRYPGVFSPFPLEKIYPDKDGDDEFLYELLAKGFSDSEVQEELKEALQDDEDALDLLNIAFKWLGKKEYEPFTDRFFPKETDIYIDGGAIDNTPSNSAIDAIREDTYLMDEWRRDATLDLYAVLLHKLPSQNEADASDPSMYDVVTRTLEINSAAKLTTDANYAEIVSSYGNKAEQLAEMLLVLLEAIDELNDEAGSGFEKEKLRAQVREVAKKYDALKYTHGNQRKGHFEALMEGNEDEIFSKIKNKAEGWLDTGLPLDLNIVKIYPDEMPLHTVAFTERLGFERQKGIEMITMGCYNALWDLRVHLENKPEYLRDQQDQWALELTRRWTGIDKDGWPKKSAGTVGADVRMQLRDKRADWKCQRTACVFHRRHCAHGADEEGAFRIDS